MLHTFHIKTYLGDQRDKFTLKATSRTEAKEAVVETFGGTADWRWVEQGLFLSWLVGPTHSWKEAQCIAIIQAREKGLISKVGENLQPVFDK